MTACFSLKMVRLFPPWKVPIRDGRAKEEMTDDWFFFLYRRPVGGLRSGLPGAATDQLQAVSRAQRQQDQTGYPARAETGMFICCIITRAYIPPPIVFFFLHPLLHCIPIPLLRCNPCWTQSACTSWTAGLMCSSGSGESLHVSSELLP